MNQISPPLAPLAPTPLFAALVKAQLAVKAALKTSKNTYHGYAYASAEEVLSVAREALNEAGLAFFQASSLPELAPEKGPPILRSVYYLVHQEGGMIQIISECAILEERGRAIDKATFGARTESLGYALRDLLLIPRQDAPDVSGREDRPAPPPKPENSAAKSIALANAAKRAILAATTAEELSRVREKWITTKGIPYDLQQRTLTELDEVIAKHPAWIETQPAPPPAPEAPPPSETKLPSLVEASLRIEQMATSEEIAAARAMLLQLAADKVGTAPERNALVKRWTERRDAFRDGLAKQAV